MCWIKLDRCVVSPDRLETENDSLKGKHVAHSSQLQDESISLPTTVMVNLFKSTTTFE
jgi:hypothetical protein